MLVVDGLIELVLGLGEVSQARRHGGQSVRGRVKSELTVMLVGIVVNLVGQLQTARAVHPVEAVDGLVRPRLVEQPLLTGSGLAARLYQLVGDEHETIDSVRAVVAVHLLLQLRDAVVAAHRFDFVFVRHDSAIFERARMALAAPSVRFEASVTSQTRIHLIITYRDYLHMMMFCSSFGKSFSQQFCIATLTRASGNNQYFHRYSDTSILTASSRHIDNQATGCPCPDTTPCSRNSLPMCIPDVRVPTPYGTSCTAPERLSCHPQNASSATFRYE